MNDRLAEYGKWLDIHITETNTALAKTRTTELASIADRMKQQFARRQKHGSKPPDYSRKGGMRLAAGVVLSVVLTGATCWAQQSARPWDELVAHSKTYGMFGKDLAAMGKATPDNLEGAVGTDLMQVVLLANEMCGAARDLLMMRDLVRAADRQEVDQFLRLRLGQQAEMFDNLVEMVNRDLAWTKSAGIAATANRLKDQLRSTKALLERSRPAQQ